MNSAFEIVYHPEVVKEDLPKISQAYQQKIRRAIKMKLTKSPQEFGELLRRTLKGYWKLCVGDYRVIFKVEGKTVILLRIGHCREIYER